MLSFKEMYIHEVPERRQRIKLKYIYTILINISTRNVSKCVECMGGGVNLSLLCLVWILTYLVTYCNARFL